MSHARRITTILVFLLVFGAPALLVFGAPSLLVFGAPAMAANHQPADYQRGLAAFKNQDYAAALSDWRPLANQGNAFAQHNLGWFYEKGLGVKADPKTALKWYKNAAEQGNAPAQNNLGALYFRGSGTLQDFVLAHMWWNIAAAAGDDMARVNRIKLEPSMTSAQIAEAQILAREWRERFGR
jgi:TPR repeat protein